MSLLFMSYSFSLRLDFLSSSFGGSAPFSEKAGRSFPPKLTDCQLIPTQTVPQSSTSSRRYCRAHRPYPTQPAPASTLLHFALPSHRPIHHSPVAPNDEVRNFLSVPGTLMCSCVHQASRCLHDQAITHGSREHSGS